MHRKSAKELHRLFSEGEVSALEITENALSKIAKYNGELNAFLRVFKEKALQKAKDLDEKKKAGKPLGKLAGVPIALKDNIIVYGEIASCGSKFLENYRAPYQSTVARLLEEEDAILIGNTNMDEFAMGSSGIHSAFGATKNPWDTSCSPGGSSSGSATAVSSLMTPLSLGSDTGGSIRQPAALSGITGFKPTYGRVSRFGLIAFASSLDQIGPFARSVEDVAIAMEVLGKHCNRDSTSLPLAPTRYTLEIEKPLLKPKIGVPWRFLEGLEGPARKNFEESLDVYRDLGAEIVEIDLDRLKYGIAIYYILATAEASTNLARFDGIRYGVRSSKADHLSEIYDLSREEGFGDEVKNRIMLGTFVLSSGFKNSFYQKAQKVRTLIIKQYREAFGHCSIIATPAAPGTAFSLTAMTSPLDEYLQDLYTVGANLAGLPAISIPSGLSTDEMPFGLHLMGPQTHDADVLQFAHAFQKATDHHKCHPKGFGGAS